VSTTAHRQPGETFAGYTQLEVLTCCDCGIMFALPEHMVREARRVGNYEIKVFCPNGHSQGWGKSETMRERERADRERDRAARLASERDQAQASARAQRAAATRARRERDKDRRRVANGVCPCCGRTFKQLARHMQSKHPEFVAEADEAHR
jgi:hypothetical protein